MDSVFKNEYFVAWFLRKQKKLTFMVSGMLKQLILIINIT
jgi:hypothetical protein